MGKSASIIDIIQTPSAARGAIPVLRKMLLDCPEWNWVRRMLLNSLLIKAQLKSADAEKGKDAT